MHTSLSLPSTIYYVLQKGFRFVYLVSALTGISKSLIPSETNHDDLLWKEFW